MCCVFNNHFVKKKFFLNFEYDMFQDKMEQTYVMIKPDGVHRGLVGRVIQRFEEKGLQLIGLRLR